MNRFKKYLFSAGILFTTLFSLPLFAKNTTITFPNLADSVYLYATRTTATVPDVVTINVTVGKFTNINEFLFSMQWDPTKLEYMNADNSSVAELFTTAININDVALGKIRFTWTGLPLTLADGAVTFKLQFRVSTYSATPAVINFIDETPDFNTVFKNSTNQTLPLAGSYGEVRMFPAISCNSRIPGLTCQTAPLLCPNEFPYCSKNNTTTVGTSPGNAICFPNDVNNNVWLAFIAGSDAIDFKIKAANCTGQGIQVAIIASDNCVNFTPLNPTCCNRDISLPNRSEISVLEARNLTIGKTYYIMVDGYGNAIQSICDFSIFIEKGQVLGATASNPTISGVSTICSNQSNIPFSIPAQAAALSYNWKIAGGNATILTGGSTNAITVNWGTVADSVCVNVVDRCGTSPWFCKAVAIGTGIIKDITAEKCATGTYFFDNQNIRNPGTYTARLLSSSGCDSIVNLTLTNYPAATRTLDSTVCIGSSVRIGRNTYSVAGTTRDTLVGASFRGCDSIIILNLLVIQSNVNLTPQNPVLTCQTQSINLTANYTKEPSSAVESFEWTNASGQVISRTSTATVTQTGSYKFKLTLSLNGISCSQERTIAVSRTGAVPTKPDLTGVGQSCTARVDLFKVNNPVSGMNYNWVVTGGTFSGVGSSQITVNWNPTATSAKICVDAENGCGKSDSICKTVDMAYIPTPLSITGDATVCPSATGNYAVVATPNVTNYQWSVLNGTITSGQGTPSVMVAWATATTGRVCMTPSNRCGTGQQGCFDVQIKNAQPDSLPIQGNVSVCSNDTTVFTNNAAGLQFNWDVPTGASILRGQGTNTILVVWGTSVGNQTVGLTLTNACNLTRRVSLNVAVKNASLNTPLISGAATICPMSRATYSIPSDVAIVAYKWTAPSGATIVGSSTTNTVSIDWGSSTGGSVCVEIQNNCNSKKSVCLAVEVKATLDSLPLAGPTLMCKDSTAVFEVQNDPNAGGYLWALPVGASVVRGLNTNKLTIQFGSSSGYVRVVPLGGCADGQASRRYVTVNVPPTAPSSIVGTVSLCEGSTTTFSIAAIPGITAYQWQIPNGAQIVGDSTSNQITVNLGTSRGGQLCARGVNSCNAGFWTCTTVAIITKPTVNAGNDTIVCGNRVILRGTTTASVQTWSAVDKPVGATVSFTTPFNLQTEVIVSKSGTYILKFESANAIGCGRADSIRVDFKESPLLTLASEDCNLEATQYNVRLNVTGNAPPYTMTGSIGGVLNLTGNFISNPIMNGTAYSFSVKDLYGCQSNEVKGMKTCPCYTSAGMLRQEPIVVCYGTSSRVIAPTDGRKDGNDTHEFILHNGTATQRGTILKRNKTGVFDATSLQFDRIYYVAYIVGDSLTNGVVDLTKPCAGESNHVSIVFKNKLTASLTGDTIICRNSNASLNFKTNQTGLFNLSLREETGARTINNVLSGQTINVNPLLSTTYRLVSVKDKDGCLAEIADSVRVNIKQLPIPNAGVDRSICQTSTVLEAAENLQYIGSWSSLTANVRITTPSDPKSAVTNLQNGRNVFVWAVADTTCPNYMVRDTVQIFLPLIPKANTLSLVTTVGKPVSGSVSENAPTGTYTITQLTNPTSGTFSLFNNGNFIYRPGPNFVGIVKFKFAVCSDLCTRLCDTGEVRILINPKPVDSVTVSLDIPNTITPNGDGKNDVLKIDNIEQYPNNELVIFNRWGDVLYKAKPYLNDWQGVNQSGGDLPEGTYYYVLRLNVNEGKVHSGNMTILR